LVDQTQDSCPLDLMACKPLVLLDFRQKTSVSKHKSRHPCKRIRHGVPKASHPSRNGRHPRRNGALAIDVAPR